MNRPSAESVLQALRAVLAKELVLGRGFSRAHAARLLRVTPPAVSQYVSGKRGGRLVEQIEHDKLHMAHVRELVRDLLARPEGHAEISGLLLKTSDKIAAKIGIGPRVEHPDFLASEGARRQSLQLLRARLEEEHGAAAGSMRFAQSAQDEMIAALFRQIASDSLRHADTMAVLIKYVEHPENLSGVRLPSKEAVVKMIEAEEAADTDGDISPLKARLGPAARLLLESVDADERKHVLLLKGLLTLIESQEKQKTRWIGKDMFGSSKPFDTSDIRDKTDRKF
ncbi:hypothetical protein HY994_00935 [Candidatus Micrarchaeota archaeon]|nr:hypothetical protein [Candidatus Micrarchaeota archaeon]